MDAPTLRLLLAVFGLASLLAAPSRAADVAVKLAPGDSFVVQDNTGVIERLNVEETTGNISRNGALFVHTTGSDSSFVGVDAGNASTTGSDNSAWRAGDLRGSRSYRHRGRQPRTEASRPQRHAASEHYTPLGLAPARGDSTNDNIKS